MSVLVVLLSLALVIATLGFVYRLAIMYLIAPKIIKEYGVQDMRSQRWISRVKKLCNRKILLGFMIIIIFCSFDLAWIAIRSHIL